MDFYFSEKILKQLELSESEYIYKSSPTSIPHQLAMKHYDLVIIGTAHRYFNVFKEISDKYNTSVVVHNLNFTQLSRFELFKNLFKKDFYYRLKLLLKEGLLNAPKVYESAKHQLVLDEHLVKENLKFLPVFFNEFSQKTNNKNVTIVIPGAVSQSRRDYKMVLKKLMEFRRSKIALQNFQIIFLGKASGLELTELQSFENENQDIQIKYFKDKVPQSEFDFWMNKADFLWCPIQKQTEFFNNQEIYGLTKMTGNIGDAIKYAKNAIFPPNYSSPYPFIINQEEDLWSQFQVLKDKDFDRTTSFSKDNISMKLHQTLHLML